MARPSLFLAALSIAPLALAQNNPVRRHGDHDDDASGSGSAAATPTDHHHGSTSNVPGVTITSEDASISTDHEVGEDHHDGDDDVGSSGTNGGSSIGTNTAVVGPSSGGVVSPQVTTSEPATGGTGRIVVGLVAIVVAALGYMV